MVYRQYEKQIGQSYIIELCIISGGVHYYLGGILDLKQSIYLKTHWTMNRDNSVHFVINSDKTELY